MQQFISVGPWDDERVLEQHQQLVAEMAAVTDAEVIYFSTNPQHHVSLVLRARPPARRRR